MRQVLKYLAIEAQKVLAEEGIDDLLFQCHPMNLFEEQPKEYRESVLPCDVRKRVAVEMGASFDGGQYVGLDGATDDRPLRFIR